MPNGLITVTEVYVLDFTPTIAEHTCARCGYAPRPYVESSLRMDLWSAACVIADGVDLTFDFDNNDRLIIGPDDVTWLALCGNSNDTGWVGSPLPDEGAYGGNDCLGQLDGCKVPCVPLQFEADD